MRYRYAIYFVPDQGTALYKLGSSLLGYDIYARQLASYPELPLPEGLSMEGLTEKPQHYGLHATVVAPFFICGITEDKLLEKAATFCRSVPSVTLPRVEVVEHRGFMALRPVKGEQREQQAYEQLRALAAKAVRFFFPLRAPLDLAELSRRLTDELSPEQTGNVLEWGYPYIFDEYDFHLTLTGLVHGTVAQSLQSVFCQYFAGAVAEPLKIDHLCVCRQPVSKKQMVGEKNIERFTVLKSFPLTCGRSQGKTL